MRARRSSSVETMKQVIQKIAAGVLLLQDPSCAFISIKIRSFPQALLPHSHIFFAKRQGFGNADKTYGPTAESIINDIIDEEGAMQAFFSSREEWLPLFRTVAGSQLPKHTAQMMESSTTRVAFSQNSSTSIDFHSTSSPWRQLEGIPQDEDDRAVLAKFLDCMYESLVDIPVNEFASTEITDSLNEDENDIQFLEEGRRMLALSRFHVIRENYGGSVESVDDLFANVWSEVMELTRANTTHTGSIILLPDYGMDNLRRFTDMSVKQPLKWLGVQSDFEVVSIRRHSPAIRLLYKLQDMPSSDAYTEDEGFAACDDSRGSK